MFTMSLRPTNSSRVEILVLSVPLGSGYGHLHWPAHDQAGPY